MSKQEALAFVRLMKSAQEQYIKQLDSEQVFVGERVNWGLLEVMLIKYEEER